MQKKPFIHLHVHTEFSLLDGLSRIKSLVKRAKELEMPALAITDHGTMFGVMDFFNACVEEGIKPIIGVEAYLARRGMEDRDAQLDKRPYHMLLLAQNMTGYKNLLKISSEAQLRGYYYRPRVDLDFLANHSEGLIATTGCLAAKIPTYIMAGQDEDAEREIGTFVDIFGPDNFYLEIQNHDIPEIGPVNQWLVDYNRNHHTHVGLLATNDTHYVLKDDFDAHDTLLCIQTSASKAETNRLKLSDNSYYLSDTDEMWQHFGDVPEAIYNSQKIAEMCEIDLSHEGYHLPIFPVPEGFSEDSYLRYLCELGMGWRFGDNANDPVLTKRLNRELDIIHDMGFDTYFLIVWDLCEFARHKDIWWNVRGSGAGSLTAYCLGITNINPIQNNLLFERFLNPGRISMPDIDLDYPDDRRGEMIAYTARKYGEDRVAAIITFGTLGAKAAVRDVGRALDVPLPDVNRAAALIPQEARQKPLEVYVNTIPELKQVYETDREIRQIIDTAKLLQGVSRHASTHAAGVIVADKPLVEYLPLHRITGKDPSNGALKAVTQFPMETCESIGLLKIDFLGLSTLTIMRKAADLIEQHHGIKYTMDNIPYRHDDPHLSPKDLKDLDAAFDLMGSGETVGVFQVESAGMQQMLRGMKPRKFENIIAAVSLYRPGPMEFIPQYNRRLHGKEEVEYRHEKMASILAETYGIIVYQEQIMQIAGDLFGYDLGEADLMRRAVSKKKAKDLQKHKSVFLERGPENGIDEASAEKIFDDIEFFANYGFNKSHAADYAVITVQTAFLKAHYPEEYMTALLTVQQDDSAKVAHFLEECRRMNIPILPPDVNFSALDFDIQIDPVSKKRGIRFGLAAIKNASSGALESMIKECKANGAFASLIDFCQRVDLREVGKRTIESLAKVGAMADFGDRSALIDNVERIVGFSSNYHKDKEIGQMNFFGGSGGISDESLNTLEAAKTYSDRDLLKWEKELLGLYVTGRPVDKFRHALTQSGTRSIQDMKQEPGLYNERDVIVAGEIVSLRKIYTRNNEPMAVIQLEDWHDSAGTIEIVIFPRIWTDVMHFVESGELTGFDVGEIVKVSGKFDTSRGDPQIQAVTISQNFDVMMTEAEQPAYDDRMPVWADVEDNHFGPPALNGNDTSVYDDDDIYDDETGEVSQPIPEPIPQLETAVAPATQGAIGVLTASEVPQFVAPEKQEMPVSSVPHPLDQVEEQINPRHVVIYFQRSGDDSKDRLRLRRLHGMFIKYPGYDRFSIILEEPDQEKPHILEFPNHSTGYCEDLYLDLLSVLDSAKNIALHDLYN